MLCLLRGCPAWVIRRHRSGNEVGPLGPLADVGDWSAGSLETLIGNFK